MKNILLTLAGIAILASSCSNTNSTQETGSEPDSLLLKKSYEAERKTKAPLLAERKTLNDYSKYYYCCQLPS